MNLLYYFFIFKHLVVENGFVKEDYARVAVVSEAFVYFCIMHGYVADGIYICFAIN